MHMRRTADRLLGDDYEWSILGAGKNQMPLATIGAAMGSHVRVGLEDSLWIGPGQLATSNAQQVTRIRTILEALNSRSPPRMRPGRCCGSRAATRSVSERVSILVAPDSFNGTSTAVEVSRGIAAGIRRSAALPSNCRWPTAAKAPSTSWSAALDARRVSVRTVGPWGDDLGLRRSG